MPLSAHVGVTNLVTLLPRPSVILRYAGDAMMQLSGQHLAGYFGPRKRQHNVVTKVVNSSCRLTGSTDLFDEASEQGLPGGLAAARRPAYGLNGVSYFGKVRLDMCISRCESAIAWLLKHVASSASH